MEDKTIFIWWWELKRVKGGNIFDLEYVICSLQDVTQTCAQLRQRLGTWNVITKDEIESLRDLRFIEQERERERERETWDTLRRGLRFYLECDSKTKWWFKICCNKKKNKPCTVSDVWSYMQGLRNKCRHKQESPDNIAEGDKFTATHIFHVALDTILLETSSSTSLVELFSFSDVLFLKVLLIYSQLVRSLCTQIDWNNNNNNKSQQQ